MLSTLDMVGGGTTQIRGGVEVENDRCYYVSAVESTLKYMSKISK